MNNQKATVIVIDPGHGGIEGGADDGASYNGVTERYINIQTANAMYEELSQYDNVKVYMTHDNPDIKMSLQSRAEFAKSVDADILISLHYNASECHLFYGSEVWIPSIGRYYSEGYKYADALLKEFEAMGLYIRGIKTRVGEDGEEYYGIIRESEKLGIPAVIVEHCHLDNRNDSRYFCSEEMFKAFGKADATAAAKYLGLKNIRNAVDYTSYVNPNVLEPENRIYQDMTAPDICNAGLSETIAGDGSIELWIEAKDDNSKISYYSYSLDGGVSYSDLFEWNDMDCDGKINIIISNVNTDKADVTVRVYNSYNLQSESGVLTIEGINGRQKEDFKNISSETREETYDKTVWYNGKGKFGLAAFLMFSAICAVIVFRKRLKKV